jgi:deoxyribodipyrimidine photo-lyase
VLESILKLDEDIGAVFINKDYTDYAIKREAKLKNITENYDCDFFSYEDYLLHNVNTIVNSSGKYYSVFSPYYRQCIKYNVDKPLIKKYTNYINFKYNIKHEVTFNKINKFIFGNEDGIYNDNNNDNNDNNNNEIEDNFISTREEGLKKIKAIKNHKQYAQDRDNLYQNTTRLSPYIKFGLVSIREVYHKIFDLFGKKHDLIRQLYWRDFYYNIAYNRPDIFKSKSFKKTYDAIVWKTNINFYTKWKEGKTGYPVVDAGMRELNATGYMHNRTRLITSNFLVKHLFIDWRKGEKYYASKLIDYDPSINNGNWQFSASSGADAQPYFRMINPWLQAIKFDPDCEYIKKWIPELRDVPVEDIHDWQNQYHEYNIDYPAPCKIYDFNKLKKESKAIYLKAFKNY